MQSLNRKLGPKRNHHVIPRFYLKGFAAEPGKVWVYQKGEPLRDSKFHPNPRLGRLVQRKADKRGDGVGAVRDFYAYKKAGGDMDYDSFENFLEVIERRGNPVLAKMREGVIPMGEDRKDMALYLAHFLKDHRHIGAGSRRDFPNPFRGS